MRPTTRRRFMILGGQTACAVAGLSALGPLVGCPTEIESEIPDDEGWLTLALDEYPDLQQVGGMTVVEVEGEGVTLAVGRLADDEFAAIDAICSHAQCTLSGLDADAGEFACPCHGSTFATDGSVTAGPATEALGAFETEYDANAGEVRIRVT